MLFTNESVYTKRPIPLWDRSSKSPDKGDGSDGVSQGISENSYNFSLSNSCPRGCCFLSLHKDRILSSLSEEPTG